MQPPYNEKRCNFLNRLYKSLGQKYIQNKVETFHRISLLFFTRYILNVSRTDISSPAIPGKTFLNRS